MRWSFVLALGLFVPSSAEAEVSTIVVGSKAFTESRVLAEVIAQLLESRTPHRIERRLNLGGTVVAFTGLKSGEIDIYPEYTGTGWAVLLKREERVSNPLRVYSEVARVSEQRWDIRWLAPMGFNNGYAMAMAEERAEELGIETLSDLAGYKEELSVGVSHEFLNRKDGYPGLQAHYGFDLKARGIEHGLAYEALRSGQLDLIDTYTTDGKLLEYPVRLLRDDRDYFPPYDAVPLLRGETARKYPDVALVLGELAYRISDRRMQQMNRDAEQGGGRYAEVARNFLEREGLLGSAPGAAEATKSFRGSSQSWGEFIRAHGGDIGDRLLEHIFLTLISVFLAIVLAVPAGIYLTRNPWLAGPVLGVTGAIQTIPGLALVALMIPIPFLGLGTRSAIVALLLYALLPILRNTYTGILGVDPILRDAAKGIGLTDREILTRVELPLAIPTLMAGVRTAAVIGVGVATLAAFVGAGGLGEPIVTGLQLNDTRLIIAGAIPAAGLALGTDGLLGVVERRLGRRGAAEPDG